jgi:hypothetical protein
MLVTEASSKLDGPEHASRAEPSSAIERYQVRLPLLKFGLEKQWQELLLVDRDCVKC